MVTATAWGLVPTIYWKIQPDSQDVSMAKYVGWCNTLHSPARVEETVGFRRKPPRMKVAVPPFCWMNMPWIQSHNGRRRGLPGCQCEMNVSVVATQRFFSFTPNLGGRFPIWLYNMFQMGWNNQPVFFWGGFPWKMVWKWNFFSNMGEFFLGVHVSFCGWYEFVWCFACCFLMAPGNTP